MALCTDPQTDSWRPMSRLNAPEPRSQMAAVWTGEEMLVWGGWTDGGACPGTGGSYNPRTDSWTPLPIEGAPVGRMDPAFVWTGRELIVWGGFMTDGERSCGSGGRYDPETRKWRPLSADGAPLSVRGAAAVWTGKEMLVWGGAHLDGSTPVNVGLRSGSRYNPDSDTWRPMSLEGAPEAAWIVGRLGQAPS
jgi:N-acetylneuraminic acid mutarotase